MAIDKEPFVFAEEEITGFKQGITDLDQRISPNAINLTVEEIRRTYKLGAQALPFVEEILKCAKEYPQFGMIFFNLDRLEKNFTLYGQTNDLAKDLGPVLEKFKDTSIKAGADAFKDARAFYQAVVAAAKANKPGADA
ncbi:MAG: hypothetical protein GY950_20560, partial [bacterium]|nr:hypothetical protein [bacterium]